jgi:hypothetical protein
VEGPGKFGVRSPGNGAFSGASWTAVGGIPRGPVISVSEEECGMAEGGVILDDGMCAGISGDPVTEVTVKLDDDTCAGVSRDTSATDARRTGIANVVEEKSGVGSFGGIEGDESLCVVSWGEP